MEERKDTWNYRKKYRVMRRNKYISVTVVITRTHSMGNGSMGPRLVLLLSLPILSYLKDCSVDIDICKLFQINLIVLLQYMIFDSGSKGSLAPIVHNQRWKIKISSIWKRQVCIVNLLGKENLAQPIYIGRGGIYMGVQLTKYAKIQNTNWIRTRKF